MTCGFAGKRIAVAVIALAAWPAGFAGTEPGPGRLPGATSPNPELETRLAAALAARGAGYRPRTRHLRADGSPKYVNRLILESSPYLLQHAHNPVNWYPWGEDALTEARRLHRPILLSIGYSTCHWCHVMEEESFEDEEVADFLNTHYIAIKVDREERPDLDEIYMAAVQALTGRGGWPTTVWLTPDGMPFFGGTYFPARDGDRGARTGFLTLLRQLRETYDAGPDTVAAQARQITERIRQSTAPAEPEAADAEGALGSAIRTYRSDFDTLHGGRRQAPKFPSSLPVRLLLRVHHRTGDEHLRRMAEITLDKMAAGGIRDHVGGGFHRYSTDDKWLVPHFEKMLYDNALLAMAYLEAYQLTGRADFADVARKIFGYVSREMTAPGGAFYTATDADSLDPNGKRREGWFFTWTPKELRAVLGEREARRFQAYYGVTERGNFEGRNILHVTRPVEEVARLWGVSAVALHSSLDKARGKLLAARSKRPAPLRDDKIVVSWNGLMISALARGGFILDDAELLQRAQRAADFVLARMIRDGRLLRSYVDGQARHNAYLDDYAFLTAALLDLFEATSSARWIEDAIRLQGVLDQHHADRDRGGYYTTSDDHETLIARQKPSYDGAEPAGNSVALMNLYRLHELTMRDAYRMTAENLVRGLSGTLKWRPTALSEMLLALDFRLGSPKEVIVVTAGPREHAAPFLDVLRRTFVPNKVVAVVSEGVHVESLSDIVPLVKGKQARDGKPTAYVCERGFCELPTTDVKVFGRQLKEKVASDRWSGSGR